jgi:hypothetical protein
MANKALLVAVNIYKLPGSNLSGCVNDLKYFDRFAVKDICVLVDAGTTRPQPMPSSTAPTTGLSRTISASMFAIPRASLPAPNCSRACEPH